MRQGENPLGRSGFIVGFALLMLLPVFIALFDVSFGSFTPYETRLIIWNQPWSYVSSIAVFLTWVSARRGKTQFITISALDLGIIGVLTLLSLVLSRTVSENPQIADLHLGRLGLAVLLGVSAYYGMKTHAKRFSQIIYRTLIVAALGVALIGLFFIYFQQESRDLGASIVWALPGFGPLRTFGIFYEVTIVLCIGLVLTAGTRSTMVLLGVALVILWVALFWSGGRGALVSLFLTIGLGALLFRSMAAQMWMVFLISGSLGALLSLFLWLPDNPSFGFLNLLQTSTREGANAFSAGRLARWMAAIGLVGEHPLYGYGLNQFSNLWSGYTNMDESRGHTGPVSVYFLSYRHVHNIVFEAMLAWGVIGAGLFLVLLFKTWFKAAKRVLAGLPTEKLPAFLALNTLLFHSNFTGIYIFSHSMLYLAIFFGICLAPNAAQNENTNG